jgi:glutathione synthase/RimK-type ligase-like ATP-grasp enzyme
MSLRIGALFPNTCFYLLKSLPMKIAYITYSGALKYATANNFNENAELLPLLQSKGLDITSEIWDDPKVDWAKYDVAVLKTPWDYHQKFEQFNRWLDHLESSNLRLFNDYRVVRWNMDKHYLQEIEQSGFEIIPSVFLSKGWKEELAPLFERLATDKLIIKPCVSGGSKDTLILNKATANKDIDSVVELLEKGDFIIQPMMSQIQEGEWSFIFFGGKYSHTIIKKPREGDFRVQQMFGGTIETVSPDQIYIDVAERYISRYAKDSLYARVDGLIVDGRFMLMELELVEPFLYLSYHPDAVEKYYTALKEKLSSI